MRKVFIICFFVILCICACSNDSNEVPPPQTVDGKELDLSHVELDLSSENQEVTITGLESEKLYGIMPLGNGSRSISKERLTGNPLGAYIFKATDSSFSFTPSSLDLGTAGRYSIFSLKEIEFDESTDMILDFSEPELFRDFDGNRVYMNYYQVDMNDYGRYNISDRKKVTFVDMILDADGETSAYIFDDIPEERLSWSGVHDLSSIGSFRFLMLAKAEAGSDGQWQIAMRTPIDITVDEAIALKSPATYLIDNTQDELILEIAIPRDSTIDSNRAIEFFPVDPEDGPGFNKCAMKIVDGKLFIHIGKLDYPVYFESYWWNESNDVEYGEIENGLLLRKVSETEREMLEAGKMVFSEKKTVYTFPLKSLAGDNDMVMLKGFFEFADGYDPAQVRVSVDFSEGLKAECHLAASSPNNHGVYNRGGSFSNDLRIGERPEEAFVYIKNINSVENPMMTVTVEDISR